MDRYAKIFIRDFAALLLDLFIKSYHEPQIPTRRPSDRGHGIPTMSLQLRDGVTYLPRREDGLGSFSSYATHASTKPVLLRSV
jgi:hypothetical protein